MNDVYLQIAIILTMILIIYAGFRYIDRKFKQ